MNYKSCNPNAIKEVNDVLKYLNEISGDGIITGQHTKTKAQEELTYIHQVTGKLPALCGFELLAYSPNINYENSDDACLKEVNENKNTLEEAWRSEEHTSELQSRGHIVCRLLLETNRRYSMFFLYLF